VPAHLASISLHSQPARLVRGGPGPPGALSLRPPEGTSLEALG